MTKRKIDKTAQKRELWVARTAAALKMGEADAAALLRIPRKQSVRINPLQAPTEETVSALRQLGWQGEQYDWFALGYTVDSPLEAIRDSQLVANGQVFIQNAASWLPVLALDTQPGERILDVCAAPGGKTTHIAAQAGNKAVLWANDNSRPRLVKLQATVARLGAHVERFTLFDATQLARKLDDEQFDKILLDAPCSGEGPMHLDQDKDFATWSLAQIKRLQQLQKRILTQAWQLLKPGGRLVYSTCTMAPEENEAVVDYLLRSRQEASVVPLDLTLPNRMGAVSQWNGRQFDARIQHCMRLMPSQHIEAFFVCTLEKVAYDNGSVL
jgi:NOL1/NOP2/sun family putative RNA methylase